MDKRTGSRAAAATARTSRGQSHCCRRRTTVVRYVPGLIAAAPDPGGVPLHRRTTRGATLPRLPSCPPEGGRTLQRSSFTGDAPGHFLTWKDASIFSTSGRILSSYSVKIVLITKKHRLSTMKTHCRQRMFLSSLEGV